jgi:hypothetical protein
VSARIMHVHTSTQMEESRLRCQKAKRLRLHCSSLGDRRQSTFLTVQTGGHYKYLV